MKLAVEKGTKEGEAFQALTEKHSQVIANCQLKLKSLVIEAGNLDLVEKKKLAIISFVELVHNVSEGFLTYDDKKRHRHPSVLNRRHQIVQRSYCCTS